MTIEEMQKKLISNTPYSELQKGRLASFHAGNQRSLQHAQTPGTTMAKVDIRGEFAIKEIQTSIGNKQYMIRETSGFLGHPDHVQQFRNRAAQSKVSAGTKMDASHRAGSRLGGAETQSNLDPLARWLNRGKYPQFVETPARNALRAGNRVYLVATAVYSKSSRLGKDIPVSLRVHMFTINSKNEVRHDSYTFGNFPKVSAKAPKPSANMPASTASLSKSTRTSTSTASAKPSSKAGLAATTPTANIVAFPKSSPFSR